MVNLSEQKGETGMINGLTIDEIDSICNFIEYCERLGLITKGDKCNE